MTRPSHRQAWIDGYLTNGKEYIPALLARDRFQHWDRGAPPDMADHDLRLGVEFLCAAPENHDAVRFVERCRLICERIVQEEKYLRDRWAGAFPLNRAETLRAWAYSRAILGQGLDADRLRQASQDFEEWCRDKANALRSWDDQDQAFFLAAARLSLLAGDLQRAQDLLNVRKNWKWHPEQRELLSRLAYDAQGAGDAAFRDRFEVFFDLIRDPRFKPDVFTELDILRLEWAALREMYLIKPGSPIDWRQAIAAIAE